MKKLTYLDKKTLMTNQKIFELRDPRRKKVHFLWFKLTKLNKLAKKYDIDLYAIPSASDYVFHYTDKSGKEKSYSPYFRISSEIWSKEHNIFKRLREDLPKSRIVFFIDIPYFEGGIIMRKNIYKEVDPCANVDYVVIK